MVGTPFAIFRQAEIDEAEAQAARDQLSPHIYMVTRRPRITVDPSSIKITAETISGSLLQNDRGVTSRHEWTRRNDFGSTDLKLDIKYPFTQLGISRPGGKFAVIDASVLLAHCTATRDPPYSSNWLDLEVLYVGQSFGGTGELSAFGRLRTHSTLQKIYADSVQTRPDADIWLVVFNFEETKLARIEASNGDANAEVARILGFMEGSMSLQHKINFTEAALIRYLQPEYNTTFKDRFPSPTHSSYSECFEMDLNSVVAEMQTLEVGTRFGTATRPPAFAHIAAFQLPSTAERRSMFSFAGTGDRLSGPVF